jgi:hypothetical protein
MFTDIAPEGKRFFTAPRSVVMVFRPTINRRELLEGSGMLRELPCTRDESKPPRVKLPNEFFDPSIHISLSPSLERLGNSRYMFPAV